MFSHDGHFFIRCTYKAGALVTHSLQTRCRATMEEYLIRALYYPAAYLLRAINASPGGLGSERIAKQLLKVMSKA